MLSKSDYGLIDSKLKEYGSRLAISYDPEILAATFGQVLVLTADIDNIDKKDWDWLADLLKNLAYKIAAVRYHYQRYQEMQTSREAELLSDPLMVDLMKRGLKECETSMAFEFESWCHQVKSSLEMLVQIFFPILGSDPKQFPEPKYGAKGDKVVKHLNQLRENKKIMSRYALNSRKIDGLIQLIDNHKSAWISALVDWRDTTTHRFPYLQIAFRWSDANQRPEGPIVDTDDGGERSLLEMMKQVTDYFFDYCRTFIAFTVSCRKPEDVILRELNDYERQYLSIVWKQQGYDMDVNAVMWTFNDRPPMTSRDVRQLLDKIQDL